MISSDEERPGLHNQAELAYRRLRERLVSGHYRPGDRLTEVVLCEDLGMSRTPVREALRRLQSDGLVTSTGRGVVVSSLSEDEIRHAMQLHEALDALAAKLAATAQREGRLAPVQLTALKEAARAVEERAEAGDTAGVWRANLDFHMTLARLSGNPLLEDALDRIWARFAIISLGNISRRAELVPTRHDAIVAAIAEGDPERAAAAAAEHVHEAASRPRD
ncbi:DNA-binding GntR family transcriptional regulator [Thermocatellispora tengchongensis]|uniref:DNA-binding GntR family transcriptional regulator n=1 Tax=Thermocatellispora tengchongensis TaxID=1073253 RepID=A0A840PBY7_9ACTN|nr:GntR family transcriptional regulator [Thermocatellispora tengchongensis]MBB5133525.1 DNA-binding GntR family transcriptional regulator [Thermocatellispora tengchongensis]